MKRVECLMSDLERRLEKCERDIERLRGEHAGGIANVIALVDKTSALFQRALARIEESFVKLENCDRKLLSDLQTKFEKGFAGLREALSLSRSERKDDGTEPPKMN